MTMSSLTPTAALATLAEHSGCFHLRKIDIRPAFPQIKSL